MMLRVSAWCGKDMGEKPPLEDKSITHGMCAECLREHYPEMANKIIAAGIWLTICQAFREAFARQEKGIT